MQLKTKIAAGLSVASAAMLAATLYFTSGDTKPSRPAPTEAATLSEIKPITADPGVMAANETAKIDEFFSMLENTPPTAAMYIAMRDEFPDRYAQIKATVRKEIEEGKITSNPAERVADLTRESMAGFRDLVRQSSDDDLRKMAAAQFTLLTALEKKDPSACAKYAAEGGNFSLPQDPDITGAVTGLATAQIRAAGDATREPKKREAPGKPVFEQLVARMRQDGITDQQVFALGDGALATLPPAEQCKVAISMYHSTLTMPPAEAGTLLAAIIKN